MIAYANLTSVFISYMHSSCRYFQFDNTSLFRVLYLNRPRKVAFPSVRGEAEAWSSHLLNSNTGPYSIITGVTVMILLSFLWTSLY